MLFLSLLFSLYKGRLEEVESFVLDPLDVLFSLVPLSDLLLFHQLSSQVEASLVRGWRQSILEGSLFSHLLYEIHFGH
jgi:hypothetical protein